MCRENIRNDHSLCRQDILNVGNIVCGLLEWLVAGCHERVIGALFPTPHSQWCLVISFATFSHL